MVKNGEETAKKEGKTTGNVLPVLLGTGTGLVLLLLLTLLAAGLIWSGVLPVSIAGMSLTIAAGLCALVGGRVAVNRGSGGSIPAHGKRSRRPSLPHLGIGLPGNHWNRGVSWAVCGNPTDDIGWRLFGWANGEEEAEEKEAIKNDEDCKKSGAGFGPEKRNGTKKSRHSTVDSFRWILGRGRIGVPAGGKTVHRALYRSVFPAGSTNVHCAVSVA